MTATYDAFSNTKSMKRTEWDDWAKQFEAYTTSEYKNGRKVTIRHPAKCLCAEIEGLHNVACREDAKHRSPDGYPACKHHRNVEIRADWRGFVRGA